MAVWPGEGAAMEIEGEARGGAGKQQREKVKAGGWRIGAGDGWERARRTGQGLPMGGMGKQRLRRNVRAEGDVPQSKETGVA